ncbi:MAG: glycogen debranching protein GlgX [Phycisphaerae bacterium]|nr:glycogen debranching protein GlgX [Phycisphaerae bacterium]
MSSRAGVHVRPGRPYPLGATLCPDGVQFALFSFHATAVELCLFEDAAGGGFRETGRVRLFGPQAGVWHAFVEGIKAGQRYGYRVHGPYDPLNGHRFNPSKLLVDPYAKSLAGGFSWDDAVYGYQPGAEDADLLPGSSDSAGFVPRSVVVDDHFDWSGDAAPGVPWDRTVIYECHVKGLTALHPGVPPELRGTYLALGSPVIVEHLQRLGVTAVELLPVHYTIDERALVERGLVNYWGYNPIAFSAPASRYAAEGMGDPVLQFKGMVKALHRAGIEVILDVVFNHTAESNQLGPTLSLRGIDNAVYYHHEPLQPRFCADFTGCGNSLNVRHPRVLQLVMDSLRYWVEQMHVDGFRFDLATVLARGPAGFEPDGSFLAAAAQDPVLARVKLIAEAWDVGVEGYQVGRFPPGWSEWNDRYRDAVRRFWRGDGGMLAEFGKRLCASSDLFGSDRGACTSINFITAHDGFTLDDVVSYERKHNEANGEENRDGNNDNHSSNWGVEGPTEDADVVRVREQIKRAMLATLAFSRGVPMLTAGDELGRSQNGNNNAYCQDNEISWVHWTPGARGQALLDFSRGLLALRQEFPALRSCHFYEGKPVAGNERNDVTWLRTDGTEMNHDDWHDEKRGLIGMLIHTMIGEDKIDAADGAVSGAGRQTIVVYYNAESSGHDVALPDVGREGRWNLRLNTAERHPIKRERVGARFQLPAQAVVLLEFEDDK